MKHCNVIVFIVNLFNNLQVIVFHVIAAVKLVKDQLQMIV